MSSITSFQTLSNISSSPAMEADRWVRRRDKHLWRSIDFLHIIVMVFSLFTAMIIASLQNELSEQCLLYGQLFLRNSTTTLTHDSFDSKTSWGHVYLCDLASFAYFSAFVLSFISLWLHVVFRRVVLTERLLRFPIWILTLIFAIINLIATCIVTDGVIKFCANSQEALCSLSGVSVFNRSRWKLISLPIGGWLSTISILLNTLVRSIQLFSKPKKSPEALTFLLSHLMEHRQRNKFEKEMSENESYGTQRVERNEELGLPHRHVEENNYNRQYPSNAHPFYYPPVPQIRHIEKRSRLQRICCPCFRRRRRRRQPMQDPYRPFVVPDEYFHRVNHLRLDGMNTMGPSNPRQYHPMHFYPNERYGQSNPLPRRKSDDDLSEAPFQQRRRSSVRFEDERPQPKPVNETLPPPTPPSAAHLEINPVVEQPKDDPIVMQNDLQRSVSFRNNEDDLWTTITINAQQSVPVQSSHFNRLSFENLSQIDTSMSKHDSGVTAIHVNGQNIQSLSSGNVEQQLGPLSPPPPPPMAALPQYRARQQRHKHPSIHPPSRSFTASSEDETDLRNIKPVEEIHTIIPDKYNYEDLSKTLKSNVERLKSTFLRTQSSSCESHYDTPNNM